MIPVITLSRPSVLLHCSSLLLQDLTPLDAFKRMRSAICRNLLLKIKQSHLNCTSFQQYEKQKTNVCLQTTTILNEVDVRILPDDNMISEEANEKSASETSEAVKNLHKMSKQLINQPVNCPWTSRAPTTTVGGEGNPFLGERTSTTIPVLLNNQSSSQFYHFLRLMQLFPEVHPATLHTVMVLCKNNFFTAVDRLLYAKRCRNNLAQRRNCWPSNNRGSIHKHSFTPVQNKCMKMADNRRCNQKPNTKTCMPNMNTTEVFPNRSADIKRFVYGNRSRNVAPKNNADLPLTITPQYTVPIQPLSPTLSESDK